MRIDNSAFGKIQSKIWEADKIFNDARKNRRGHHLSYKLRYTFNSFGRVIEKEPLEDLFVFRTKLKSIIPLPRNDLFFLKILHVGTNKEWLEIDETIYPRLLNSIREIIFNQSESIFYTRILSMYKKALSGKDKDWQLEAFDMDGNNISNAVVRFYSREEKIFRTMIENGDFDFIYNGVLQHSDKKHRARYIGETESGEIFFSQYKCALLAEKIREIMLADTACFDMILNNNSGI